MDENFVDSELPIFLRLRLTCRTAQEAVQSIADQLKSRRSWQGLYGVRIERRLGQMCQGDLDLNVAVDAICRASAPLREEYNDRLSGIHDRTRHDVVLEADLRAHNTIVQCLLKANDARPRPYAIVSEESDRRVSLAELRERALAHPACWVIDPLDASTAFLHRANPAAPSVMIALVQPVQPSRQSPSGLQARLGIVHFPITEEWYYAVRGQGAYQDGEKLYPVNDVPRLSAGWASLNHYADARGETAAFKSVFRRLRGYSNAQQSGAQLVTIDVPHSGIAVRVVDSKYHVCAVVHDNQAFKAKQCVWDVCAPQVIVEEAGGVFLNSRGEPYDPFGDPDLIVVAQSGELAREILGPERN